MRQGHWVGVGLLALALGCMSREIRDELPESFTDQAVKGAVLYTTNCAKCHGALGQGTEDGPRVVGLDDGALSLNPPAGAEKRTMKFRTVADVARFVVTNMPADDPGKLSEEDYFRILAFDLRANGINLGNQHLDMGLAEAIEIPRQPDATEKPVSLR